MIKSIIEFSVNNKLIIFVLLLGWIGAGWYALRDLPIDAVPDITNNQVQVVTVSPSLAPQEVEQFITYPVEVSVANIPDVTEIRSVSRFGLSVVTIVFKDQVPILDARQYVKEQLALAREEIPAELGAPELMPITTGLGEIYQYVLQVEEGFEHRFDPMRLRTIQDWIVKRQLAGIPGIIEVSSFGGYLKQYEVAVNPMLLQSTGTTMAEVFEALSRNNQNSGGSYIEKSTNAYYIRTEGVVSDLDDIARIVISNRNGRPILIRDIGKVQLGSPKRFGAMTMDGKGEAVGGITLMLKGSNSSSAIQNVRDRIEEVQKILPEGVHIYPYLDRSVLVGKTIRTVITNLVEGGLIVILVLVLLLGDLRAGLIVASVIPLSMLFAIMMMRIFGVSANLMSLGAIDFGIVVDGAVIIVEAVLHTIFTVYVGRKLTQAELNAVITESASKVYRSAAFGVLIILVVFLPILSLTGIEGKMFRPMAQTFSFAILGALLLSVTYVPMMASLILPKTIRKHVSFADKLMARFRAMYRPSIRLALRMPGLVLGASAVVLFATFLVFRTLGAEFIPTLEEGDLAMQMAVQPGSSLQESIRTSTRAETILLENFPEINHVVSKIGTAEVPTDPMAVEDADIMILLKDKKEWTSASGREELVEKMKEKLEVIAGASFEFTQPIQLRFNELMTGAKADIAVKIFGEDVDLLKTLGDRAAGLIQDIPGAGDVKVEQTAGLPQVVVRYDRTKVAEYGLNIQDLNTLVRTAFAGEVSGTVFENERKFDLVVRLDQPFRQEVDLASLYIQTPGYGMLPVSEVAQLDYVEGPMQISREGARRRIIIGVNVRDRDVGSLVADIQDRIAKDLNLPPGYIVEYGGQFENLEMARARLSLAVPVALALIFILLYFTFGSLKYATLIFSAVPLSAIGGVGALLIRGMPFSISAGVGFIALFGVAVLNGIVLISYFNSLREEGKFADLKELVIEGGCVRLRPVIMTAAVAAFGFLPMALSNTNGAEVQKPLATVVIGGLITATALTLILLPVMYYLVNRRSFGQVSGQGAMIVLLLVAMVPLNRLQAQEPMEDFVGRALEGHPLLLEAGMRVSRTELERGQAWDPEPLDIGLQLGQMNTSLFDYNISVQQRFSNPGLVKARKSLAEASIRKASAEQAGLEKDLAFAIRRDWYQWVYHLEECRLLERQLDLMEDVLERSKTQYSAGQIGGLELALAESRLLQAGNALRQAEVEREQAAAQLRQTAFVDSLPAGEGIKLEAETGWSLRPEAKPLQLKPYELQMAEMEDRKKVREKERGPAFSVGYFNQSIRPDFAFQGALLGLHVPVFRKAGKARIQQAELDLALAGNQRMRMKRNLELEKEMLREQERILKDQLSGFGLRGLAVSDRYRELATARLEAGETDFFQFFQSLQANLEAQRSYLATLHDYLQVWNRIERIQ